MQINSYQDKQEIILTITVLIPHWSYTCSWYYTFLLSLPITYSLSLWSNLTAQVSSPGEMTQTFIFEVFGPLVLDYYSFPIKSYYRWWRY